ncbi:TM2 domain-containing protein [Hasllibacter halocynthiae]|uniref:TM2 domain-containing protein n=1 Tax=Hasllibacter halocynthiae TaxID=595589 RepID=A0A2T0X679_9RHOB|nr:NINE protein [Hasllibacter halocynthiae]PRY94448.1 TM2 domain-containing protein [Hasllibacter halocynthiae]
MTITTEQQILVEQKVTNEAKSAGVAYLLLFLFGGLGLHRFYMGRTLSTVVLLGVTLAGFLMPPLFLVTLIWLAVDLFLIPGTIMRGKRALRDRFTAEQGIAGA